MLDLRFILENRDQVRQNLKYRKVAVDLDQLLQLSEQRSQLIQDVETMRQRQNEIARLMREKMAKEQRDALIEEGKDLKNRVQVIDIDLANVESKLQELQLQIPNMSPPDAPIGDGEEGNLEIKKWGDPPNFDFDPQDHVQLSEQLGIIDWQAGAKVSGSKFYFLRGDAVMLELALVHYALSVLRQEGFVIHLTPDMARQELISHIGFNPRGEESQIYSIANSDLALIATAEITLGGMYEDEILEESQLPLLFGGLSHCYRTEAGSAGRASRGLYRVHQFTKVEMFAFTTPEQSDETLEKFLAIEEKLFQGLEIPYRVVDCCTGDLGAQAYRKYDVEAWMPGRGLGGSYGEVTSASNCTDYQARRLRTRFRRENERKPLFLHTLNGTAIATSRAIVAILENFQQSDGSILVPKVLQALMGKDIITPN
jgi:seryl-tRNA synthetase